MPTPVGYYSFDWKIGLEHNVEDPDVIVGLEYDESLEFRVYLEDIKRYIEHLHSVLCFYREDEVCVDLEE